MLQIPDPRLFEKLGVFYLGRLWDPVAGEPEDELLLYDSRDLTTHALCVGMTGSGKTGLGVGLLEEAALDGVPALVLDPKGDLGNLLLTFPDLEPEDFLPWVDAAEASRRGMTSEELAAEQARRWREGLASWGQDGERIRRLRETVDVTLYTPGSTAGRPLSVLSSLAAPGGEVSRDGDLLRERVQGVTASLLGLLGRDADPVTSRDSVLLATLLGHSWSRGEDLDLGRLVAAVQDPPFDEIGVMPLEAFYPAKERFGLATALNGLLASPAFAAFRRGDPLDVDRLLYTATGEPRVSIVSLAHLSESERMFVASLVLTQTLSWVRTRPGSSSLAALLYMDEVFGFVPPVAEPPSKRPLLTLLKQARAYGLGVVLATQNPADVDYKALGNIGTWWLGRLSTERDKERLLDGLEAAGAAGDGEGGLDRARLDALLSGLGKRVFLQRNVHDSEPVVFHTRWAMSYLRGPMTRREIERLGTGDGGGGEAAAVYPEREGAEAASTPPAAAAGASAAARGSASPSRPAAPRPVLPPGVPEAFLPPEDPPGSGGTGKAERSVRWEPFLAGFGRVRFLDAKHGIDHEREEALILPLGGAASAGGVDWAEADGIEGLTPGDLDPGPPADSPGGEWLALPPEATDPKSYRAWKRGLCDHLYRERRLSLWESPGSGLVSAPGESERDFRIRLRDALREERDRRVEALRERWEKRFDRLAERLRKAEQRLEREEGQVRKGWMDTAIAVLPALLGGSRRASRAGTALRGVSRTLREREDVHRAEEDVETLVEERREEEARLAEEIAGIEARYDAAREPLEERVVAPRRADVEVERVTLLWIGS